MEMIKHNIARTYALLGGSGTFPKPLRNLLEAHDALVAGLPTFALLHLQSKVPLLATDYALEKVIGISAKALRRRKINASDISLSIEQSNRTWTVTEILLRATDLLGAQAEAEAWLNRPAIGLDWRRPIDLLCTAAGVDAVEDYLTRIDYGVYA
jgi:putative toxin-antitoxin system antitoxin component (TIGR02293 family)